ncbi:hypothetical protein BK127_40565 [Paenibacillus sp. FSL H7-0331]|nr:hypothetical protein BK127_40565 [Paenibacillus sp. FSL H7-0331]
MYSVNNNLQPSLESLIEHVEFYKTIEGNELLKEFIEQIELVKKHEYNFVLKKILKHYGKGISSLKIRARSVLWIYFLGS